MRGRGRVRPDGRYRLGFDVGGRGPPPTAGPFCQYPDDVDGRPVTADRTLLTVRPDRSVASDSRDPLVRGRCVDAADDIGRVEPRPPRSVPPRVTGRLPNAAACRRWAADASDVATVRSYCMSSWCFLTAVSRSRCARAAAMTASPPLLGPTPLNRLWYVCTLLDVDDAVTENRGGAWAVSAVKGRPELALDADVDGRRPVVSGPWLRAPAAGIVAGSPWRGPSSGCRHVD